MKLVLQSFCIQVLQQGSVEKAKGERPEARGDPETLTCCSFTNALINSAHIA